MKKTPPIKSVMTPFPYSVNINKPVTEAKKLMEEHSIRHLPVVENGKLVGVITDRDIKQVCFVDSANLPEKEIRVRDACVLEPYIVDLSEPLDNVVLHMSNTHIGSALVVKDGKLAGIFTANDACRCFGEFLRLNIPKGDGGLVA